MKLLHLVIAESALEPIPPELQDHPAVKRELKLRKMKGKTPLIILDRSRHHELMKMLPNAHKRGRPDIVYLTLQVTQYTILNSRGMLRTYVHTVQDRVLFIEPETRVPHNYNNFIGLMEQLFYYGKVPPSGRPLIRLEHMTLPQLVARISPDHVILLDDVRGRKTTFRELCQEVVKYENPCIIVGGFPHGEFSEVTYNVAHEIIKIGDHTYNTFLIVAKLLTYIEHMLNLEL